MKKRPVRRLVAIVVRRKPRRSRAPNSFHGGPESTGKPAAPSARVVVMRAIDHVVEILIDARGCLDQIDVGEFGGTGDLPRLRQYLGVGCDSLILQGVPDPPQTFGHGE